MNRIKVIIVVTILMVGVISFSGCIGGVTCPYCSSTDTAKIDSNLEYSNGESSGLEQYICYNCDTTFTKHK